MKYGCSSFVDALDHVQRDKPTNEEKCTRISRFVFEWAIETPLQIITDDFVLSNGLLRPYMQVISRHLTTGAPVEVDLSVTLNQLGNTSALEDENAMLGASAFLRKLNVTSGSDGWLELDISEPLREIWPPASKTPFLEVILKMEVNCKDQKKVPMTFVNPAEIPVSQETRRERHLELQPLLVVSINDHGIKAKIKEQEEKYKEQMKGSTIETVKRRRRSSDSLNGGACRLENFTITFSDLELDHFIAPAVVDVRRCSGACAHSNLKLNRTLATNHAKLMASARERFNQPANNLPSNATLYVTEPFVPCCVPTNYDAVWLMLEHFSGVQLNLFADFIVTDCGCR